MKELIGMLNKVSASDDNFRPRVMRYAATSRVRKEMVMDYLSQNEHVSSSQIIEFITNQPDFDDATLQIELEHKLYEVSDCYSGFVKGVLNYVSRKVGRVSIVLDYISENKNARASDILEFISNQDDFYDDCDI